MQFYLSFGKSWSNTVFYSSVRLTLSLLLFDDRETFLQVVASIHKQDSVECTKEDDGEAKEAVTTECYIGHVTHFRNDSFR